MDIECHENTHQYTQSAGEKRLNLFLSLSSYPSSLPFFVSISLSLSLPFSLMWFFCLALSDKKGGTFFLHCLWRGKWRGGERAQGGERPQEQDMRPYFFSNRPHSFSHWGMFHLFFPFLCVYFFSILSCLLSLFISQFGT